MLQASTVHAENTAVPANDNGCASIGYHIDEQSDLNDIMTYKSFCEDRTIYLTDSIDTDQVTSINQKLRLLDEINPGAPITLRINSTGGFVTDGLSLVDTIRSLQSPVDVVCEGLAASMGAVLLITATGKRTALPHCQILVHQPRRSIRQGRTIKNNDGNDRMQYSNRVREITERLISEASGLDRESVHRLCDEEKYISAEQAKELGFIDSIEPPKQTISLKQPHKLPSEFCDGSFADLEEQYCKTASSPHP